MPRWKMPTVSSQILLVPGKQTYMLAGTPTMNRNISVAQIPHQRREATSASSPC